MTASDSEEGAGPSYVGLRRRPPSISRRVQLALASTVVAGGLVAGGVVLRLDPAADNHFTLPPSAAPSVSSTGDAVPVPDPVPSSSYPAPVGTPTPRTTATPSRPVSSPSAPATRRPPHTTTTTYQAESSANTRPGTRLRQNGTIVADIGGPATLTFNGISAAGADTYEITIYYLSAVAHPKRSATILVNGVVTTSITFEKTASWYVADVRSTGPVRLNLRAGANTITIANSRADAPDIDKIQVR